MQNCSLSVSGKTNPIKAIPELAGAPSKTEGAVEWANFETILIGISHAHHYLAKGKVSGTTFTCVVNLYGIPRPLS